MEETIRRYHVLGLLFEESTTFASSIKLGEELNTKKKLLNRVGSSVIQLGVNALGTIAKLIQIEPIITLVPVPGFIFAIKGKGMNFHDLYLNLTEGITFGE